MNGDKNAAICKDVVPTVAAQFFSSHGKQFSRKKILNFLPEKKKIIISIMTQSFSASKDSKTT